MMAIKEIPREYQSAADARDDAMKEAAKKVIPMWLYTDPNDDNKTKINVI